MTSPEWSSLLNLYQRTVCDGVLQYLQKQAGLRNKRGVYGAPVVLWLMMLQRLQGRGTLASTVQLLLQGALHRDKTVEMFRVDLLRRGDPVKSTISGARIACTFLRLRMALLERAADESRRNRMTVGTDRTTSSNES